MKQRPVMQTGGTGSQPMKDLSKKFLSDTQRLRIREAVKTAEQRTSGEIVTMIVSTSYHYPVARIKSASVLAMILAVALTPLVGERFWIGPRDMWVFLILLAVGYILFYWVLELVPAFQRLFLTRKEIREEVEEAAVTAFFREQLYQTRDRTGVLIFVSVFERMVWVLADEGINSRLSQDTWQGVVDTIIRGIKEKRQADAICDAVEQVGALLAEHFPIRPDDENELRGLIIGD
jgi:putative membrane protein